MSSNQAWQQALNHYGIPPTSFFHQVTKIEDSNVGRFRDLVEQHRTIVTPLDNAPHYINFTGGIPALKTILAVVAYVPNMEHVYSDAKERKNVQHK